MFYDLTLLAAGLALLIVAGDALVRGAVALALRAGIPAFVVSLTIVAFGTSAPELLVAVQSALEGAPGIAFGNVVGSNIANVLLVLGLPALISRVDTRSTDGGHTYQTMLVMSLLFCVLAVFGPMTWVDGCVLLGLLAAFILTTLRAGGRSAPADVGVPVARGWQIGGFLAVGLVGLPVGAHLLIEGAVAVARDLNVSETVIGLTIVAVGTSLPELATAIVAAARRQGDVALGGVIGSNIFNVLAIMGVTSFFGPLVVPPQLLQLDLWVMIAASLALWPFVFWGWHLSRRWGIAFVGLYALYIGALIL